MEVRLDADARVMPIARLIHREVEAEEPPRTPQAWPKTDLGLAPATEDKHPTRASAGKSVQASRLHQVRSNPRRRGHRLTVPISLVARTMYNMVTGTVRPSRGTRPRPEAQRNPFAARWSAGSCQTQSLQRHRRNGAKWSWTRTRRALFAEEDMTEDLREVRAGLRGHTNGGCSIWNAGQH